MEDELTRHQRFNSTLMLTVSGFMLFVCEFNLFMLILAKATNNRNLWDYLALLLLVGPFLIGLSLRYRISKMQTTGEVNPRAATKINSDVTFLVFITYCLLLFLSNLHSLAQ